jgi:hypothetical protein
MRPECDGFASNGGDHQWMRRSDAAAQGGFTTVHARKEGDGGQMSDIACRKTPNTPPLRLSPHFSKVLGVLDACNLGVAVSAEAAPADGFPK